MPRRELDGPRIDGRIKHMRIERKALAAQTGIHVSTLSRFFNAEIPLSTEQCFELGYAARDLEIKETRVR